VTEEHEFPQALAGSSNPSVKRDVASETSERLLKSGFLIAHKRKNAAKNWETRY
jgi:hypothetical protein